MAVSHGAAGQEKMSSFEVLSLRMATQTVAVVVAAVVVVLVPCLNPGALKSYRGMELIMAQ